MATVKLFKMLLAKDLEKHIIKNNIKVEITKRLNDTHKTIIDRLPAITGVYYIHDENGDSIKKLETIRKGLEVYFTFLIEFESSVKFLLDIPNVTPERKIKSGNMTS